MITKQYRDQVLSEIETTQLPLELFEEKVCDTTSEDRSRIGEIVRLYITSPSLGGTLAVNHGDGWIPIFPEKENYPMKGKWLSPVKWISPEWRECVCAALLPDQYLSTSVMGALYSGAIDRAAKLRHPFRAIAAAAILKNLSTPQKEATCK